MPALSSVDSFGVVASSLSDIILPVDFKILDVLREERLDGGHLSVDTL